jgi:hypothetical protein
MSSKTEQSSSLLPLWMKNSLDHFTATTNIEEFGTSPPENESVFLHEPLHHYSFSNLNKKNDSSTAAAPSIVFKSKELKPRTARQLHQLYLQQDQVCPSLAGTASESGSTATTPSVTPQQSPNLIRKILAADLTATASHCKAVSSVLDSSKVLKHAPVTRVTNFDLNAVSPTSW